MSEASWSFEAVTIDVESSFMREADDMPPAIVNVKKRPAEMEDLWKKFDLPREAAPESRLP
jgi:hypothetical protein